MEIEEFRIKESFFSFYFFFAFFFFLVCIGQGYQNYLVFFVRFIFGQLIVLGIGVKIGVQSVVDFKFIFFQVFFEVFRSFVVFFFDDRYQGWFFLVQLGGSLGVFCDIYFGGFSGGSGFGEQGFGYDVGGFAVFLNIFVVFSRFQRSFNIDYCFYYNFVLCFWGQVFNGYVVVRRV